MGLTPSDWYKIRLYQRNLTEVQKKCLPTLPAVYVPLGGSHFNKAGIFSHLLILQPGRWKHKYKKNENIKKL